MALLAPPPTPSPPPPALTLLLRDVIEPAIAPGAEGEDHPAASPAFRLPPPPPPRPPPDGTEDGAKAGRTSGRAGVLASSPSVAVAAGDAFAFLLVDPGGRPLPLPGVFLRFRASYSFWGGGGRAEKRGRAA